MSVGHMTTAVGVVPGCAETVLEGLEVVAEPVVLTLVSATEMAAAAVLLS